MEKVDFLFSKQTERKKTSSNENKRLMVVDLSAGSEATKYPISFLSGVPAGGWSNEYKTSKLVLRRIEPGIFRMGSPADEMGREMDELCEPAGAETLHEVTITNPLYIGVFQITQKQWELVMGKNLGHYKGDNRPVERVSYGHIRGDLEGDNWPCSFDVDPDSFMGRLRRKTDGLMFDLPTEAQWEYACRAGTRTSLNTGKDLSDAKRCPEMNDVGRYLWDRFDLRGKNDCEHITVGSYQPNAWGLYDFHGNVEEWCLDWFKDDLGSKPVTDPVGPIEGTAHVIRGGSWANSAWCCRSAGRRFHTPSSWNVFIGFRCACFL